MTATLVIYISDLGDFPQEGKGWKELHNSPGKWVKLASIDSSSMEQTKAAMALYNYMSLGCPMNDLIRLSYTQTLLGKLVAECSSSAKQISEYVHEDYLTVELRFVLGGQRIVTTTVSILKDILRKWVSTTLSLKVVK